MPVIDPLDTEDAHTHTQTHTHLSHTTAAHNTHLSCSLMIGSFDRTFICHVQRQNTAVTDADTSCNKQSLRHDTQYNNTHTHREMTC